MTATNDADILGGVFDVGGGAVYVEAPRVASPSSTPSRWSCERLSAPAPSSVPTAASGSLGLAGGNGGVVADETGAWVRYDFATVGRVDPASGTITVYGGPFPSEFSGASGIAVADGSLWVTNVGGEGPGACRVATPACIAWPCRRRRLYVEGGLDTADVESR